MPWQRIQPSNSGGGRKAVALTAQINNHGQFTMSHAVALSLGEPERVLVDINLDTLQVKLTPTTPDMQGAFVLSGGGNASYRFTMREACNRYPQLIGNYKPQKIAGGMLFTLIRKKMEDEEDRDLEV